MSTFVYTCRHEYKCLVSQPVDFIRKVMYHIFNWLCWRTSKESAICGGTAVNVISPQKRARSD